jgi:DNA-directed RNA polymerase specialized sigma24 family protein
VNPESAEDVVSEAFAAVLKSGAPRGVTVELLKRAVVTRALNENRNRATEADYIETLPGQGLAPDPAVLAEVRLTLEKLYTPEEVEVLFAVLAEGFTIKEISEKYKGRDWGRWIPKQVEKLKEVF